MRNTRRFSLPPSRSAARRPRGGVLVSVVILTAVILVIAGSVLRLSLTERRLTIRSALVLESRNAAEAIAEYGFSQIRQKFETRSTFSLSPAGSDALRPPPVSFWQNSNVATSTADYELIGGTIAPIVSGSSSYYFVDPNNPNNRHDPLRGKWVWRRDVSVLARAIVRHPTGGDIVSHASQTISVRGAPLFAHAIFYNMDLELSPGPDMHIYGPVHANGDLYFAHQSDNGSLNFHGQVTTSGHLFREWKHGVGGSHGNEVLRTGHVRFANAAGELISIRGQTPAGTYTWRDSRMGGTEVSSEFRAFASSTFNGNLLTQAHGVTDYRPVAIGDYREADPYNPNASLKDPALAPSNAGRLLIEPPDPPPNPSAPDYATRREIENQKYSNDAGIYIRVVPPTTVGGTPTITVTSRSKTDPTKDKTLTLPPGNSVVSFGAYRATATYSTSADRKVYEVSDTRVQGGVTQHRYRPRTITTTTPRTITYGAGGISAETSGTPSTTNGNLGNQTGWLTSPPSDHNSVTNSSTSPSGLALAGDNRGLYDRRRQKGVNLVDIDMDGLRKAVAQMAGATARLSNGSTYTPNANDGFGHLATSDWTGIIYVEVAGAPRTDPITGATLSGADTSAAVASATAVRILNGTGRVPSHGTANEGLTIATNAPMYVQGHYNADGSTSTAVATNSARVPEAGEVPAALVADAITLLSRDFNPANTLTTNSPSAGGDIEVSAALLMGISPTNPTLGTKGESSGGAHNFPRFLENWGGRSVFIRGSLVALFESRVATEPWSTDYYSPPTRRWGFNDLFSEGRYPPGTPRVMSYRRVNFAHLKANEFNAAKAAYGW
jgi:hypothetical protein